MRISTALGQTELPEELPPLPSVGHNKPPSMIDFARETVTAVSDFLNGAPVIETEDVARDGAKVVKRASNALDDMDAERVRRVKPLNDIVKTINDEYRDARDTLERVLKELRRRLTAFAQAEEERRAREAEAVRIAAEQAEQAAREAERIEAEAKENAAFGQVDAAVGEAIANADAAFADFKRADRAAARAERDVPVRLSGGYGRKLSLRTTETLILDDAAKAIKSIGVTDKIRDAILSSARDYRKLKGKLPAGVSATEQRSI